MNMQLCKDKGSVAIIICMLMPVLIAVAGMCIDGSNVLYNKTLLGSATKYAAISAASFYTVEDGAAVIIPEESERAAEEILTRNFPSARMRSCTVNGNECTVESEADISFYFFPIFKMDSTTISESYTARRAISH